MKMKRFIYFVASCAALLACNKIETSPLNPDPVKKTITLTASINVPRTKVRPDHLNGIDSVSFKWEAGDSIYVVDTAVTEMKIFKIVNNSISEDSTTAEFIGEPLSGGMGEYMVLSGANGSTVEKLFETQTINYIIGSFKPFAYGTGQSNSFTINSFYPVFKLRLKGNATIGRIVFTYHLSSPTEMDVENVEMSCGDGIELSSDTLSIYLPLYTVGNFNFILDFYDTAGNLLKKQNSSYDFQFGKIITCPVLEIDAPEPKTKAWYENSTGYYYSTAWEEFSFTDSPIDVEMYGTEVTVTGLFGDESNVLTGTYDSGAGTIIFAKGQTIYYGDYDWEMGAEDNNMQMIDLVGTVVTSPSMKITLDGLNIWYEGNAYMYNTQISLEYKEE